MTPDMFMVNGKAHPYRWLKRYTPNTLYRCHDCGSYFNEEGGVVFHAATYWEPEDSEARCPDCGRDDYRDNDYRSGDYRATNRSKTWMKFIP